MMKIELVSLRYNISNHLRIKVISDIINKSDSSFILFSGHSLNEERDVYDLNERITNRKPTTLLEIKSYEVLKTVNSHKQVFQKLNNCLYSINDGIVSCLNTFQLFSESKHIENNEPLCEHFINELETRRIFTIQNKKCLVLQCGEINIIKNLQTEKNKPVFRHLQRSDLQYRFENLLNNTDIIFNPIHSPMGNQGKMKKRREYFSSNKRYYFSVSQNGIIERKGVISIIPMSTNSLQYSYYDGKAWEEVNRETNTNYQIRKFIIV